MHTAIIEFIDNNACGCLGLQVKDSAEQTRALSEQLSAAHAATQRAEERASAANSRSAELDKCVQVCGCRLPVTVPQLPLNTTTCGVQHTSMQPAAACARLDHGPDLESIQNMRGMPEKSSEKHRIRPLTVVGIEADFDTVAHSRRCMGSVLHKLLSRPGRSCVQEAEASQQAWQAKAERMAGSAQRHQDALARQTGDNLVLVLKLRQAEEAARSAVAQRDNLQRQREPWFNQARPVLAAAQGILGLFAACIRFSGLTWCCAIVPFLAQYSMHSGAALSWPAHAEY